MGRSINFAHFSGVKNHLLSPHILHMNCFLYPWTFLRAKKYLLVSCFQAGCRPLAPGSGDCEQCRLKLAATVLCTTGNRHTVRRRHPTRQLKCRYFMLFGKLCSVDIIWLSMLFYFGYAREGNLHWSGKFIWTLKLHESFTCFTYPWNLSHFIIISVLVFCNGLTPFNGYALRTFFTRKKD